MALKCSACGRFTTTTDGVKCNRCARYVHKACVNMTKDAKVSSSWQCPECKAHTPRRDNTENPVCNETACFSSPQESAMGDGLAEILREVRLHRAETRAFREEFDALRTFVETFNGRLTDVELRLSTLETKFSEPQTNNNTDVDSLRSTVEHLKLELNDRDQELFLNDIEITGVHEEKVENVTQLVSLIAGKLGVACEQRDIVFAERAGARRAPSSDETTNMVPRPRALVVRVARRQLRDALLQAARVRRGLTTEGMGLTAPPSRLYLNERLTRLSKSLFYKVREEARARGWKYVWTRGGKIFIRRDTGKSSFRVRSEQDFRKIFGKE